MKKKGLLFATLGASLLLVGGVVAAYAVTDNAGILGFKITPGTIEEDKVGTVTLEWGATETTDVTGLQVGTPQERNFVIKSTVAEYDEGEGHNVDTDKPYQGTLNVSIEDTSGKAASAKKLIDYLTVEVWAYTYAEETWSVAQSKVSTLNKTTTEDAINLYSVPAGKNVTVKVILSDQATPYISLINTDTVYLTVDWNKATGGGDVSGTTRVYVPDPGWSNFYFYSYGGGKENAAWPGVKITDKVDGKYVVDLVNNQNFIFTEAIDSTTNRYPADGQPGMTVESTEASATKIYYDWSSHKFTAVQSYDYYLLGESTDIWSMLPENGLTYQDGTPKQYTGTVTVVAGSDYKIANAGKTDWYGYSSIEAGCKDLVQVGDGDNFQFKVAGEYELFVKYESSKTVWITKVTE